MARSTKIAFVLAATLAAVATTVGVASAESSKADAGEGDQPPPLSSPLRDEPPVTVDTTGLAQDAAQYARSYGVTQDEAIKALEFQNALTSVDPKLEQPVVSIPSGDAISVPGGAEFAGSPSGELREAAGDRLAGIWFEPGTAKTIVSVIGDPPQELVALADTLSRSLGGTIEVRGGASSTLADLTEAVDVPWEDVVEGFSGAYASEREGHVVVQSTSPAPEPQTTVSKAVEGTSAASDDTLRGAISDVPVIFETVDDLPEAQNRGGRRLATCTSAFTVYNTGYQYGYATAGHCQSSQPYYWWAGDGPFAATYRGQSTSGYVDLQWHTTTVQAIEPLFHASTTSAREQQSRGIGQEGQYLCHFGRTTGYSCANVASIVYKPSNTDLCGYASSCQPVYSLTESNCTSELGDSGGPWFIGNAAHGIHSGHRDGGTICIFSRTYYLNQLALSLYLT